MLNGGVLSRRVLRAVERQGGTGKGGAKTEGRGNWVREVPLSKIESVLLRRAGRAGTSHTQSRHFDDGERRGW